MIQWTIEREAPLGHKHLSHSLPLIGYDDKYINTEQQK